MLNWIHLNLVCFGEFFFRFDNQRIHIHFKAVLQDKNFIAFVMLWLGRSSAELIRDQRHEKSGMERDVLAEDWQVMGLQFCVLD